MKTTASAPESSVLNSNAIKKNRLIIIVLIPMLIITLLLISINAFALVSWTE